MKTETSIDGLKVHDVPWTSWIVFSLLAVIVGVVIIALLAVLIENPSKFFNRERDGVFGIAIGVVMFGGVLAILGAGLYALISNATRPVYRLTIDRRERVCELSVRGLLRRDRLQYPFAEVCGFRADKRPVRASSYYVVQLTTVAGNAVDIHTSPLTFDESEVLVRKLEEQLK